MLFIKELFSFGCSYNCQRHLPGLVRGLARDCVWPDLKAEQTSKTHWLVTPWNWQQETIRPGLAWVSSPAEVRNGSFHLLNIVSSLSAT